MACREKQASSETAGGIKHPAGGQFIADCYYFSIHTDYLNLILIFDHEEIVAIYSAFFLAFISLLVQRNEPKKVQPFN
jgi:hypothetical protein